MRTPQSRNRRIRRNSPLLEVEDLRTWFPIRRGILSRTVGYIKAVNGVSFVVGKGETLGLVGESGCGKTTLGRTLMGLEEANSGKITFYGHELGKRKGRSRTETRCQMQMIFQDPFSSLNPRMTVLDIITEGMIHHRLIPKDQNRSEAVRMMAEVGLDGSSVTRYPHEFSGGQRQRISIARALSLNPEFIVCDEAVSALDVSVQAQVINLLMDLRDKYDLSYLFISHDLSVVRQISNRIAVMYLGKIVEEGNTDDIIDDPLHPYTQALVDAVPVPGAAKKQKRILTGEIPSPANPPSGCPFHTRCAKVMDQCRSLVPEVKTVDSRRVWCHL